MSTKLLDTVGSPADLKKLPIEKLPQLAEEIREFMIDIISHTGGHLAPSLGVIELTIALHYCYDTPVDKLVWDVGHQAYAHKILTGRRDRFHTIRQYGGLSGFPRLSESEYDALSAGHASTSISAALGMAAGRDVQKQKHSVVAVIGDGSLGGGLALEGLNNLGSMATNMTVVLNDNEMSISKNVGALSRYLTRVLTDKRYNKIKSEIWELLGGSNVGKSIRGIVSNLDYTIKNILVPGKLFEDMGLRYLGPIDGHNIAEMIEVFRSIRDFSPTPTLVHVITKKGKGYGFAENDATKYHGIGSFSRLTGDVIKKTGQVSSYSDVFGKTIVEMASSRPDLVAITAAMRDGTKLAEFSKIYPERFFDVGIAEQHAVTFAAGLALKGLCPVVALYSTFLQRAFDQVIHDIALDNLHVVFCIDRAGLVGDDGPTHHGAFDISFLRSIPGVTIMAPRDVNQLRKMMYTAVDSLKGPVFIRYPKAGIEGTEMESDTGNIDTVPELIEQGREIAIVSIGDFFSTAKGACEILKEKGLSPALVDARFAKPLDSQFYRELFSEYKFVVTMENNALAGGFGSSLLELAATLDLGKMPKFLCLGLPDSFVPHGNTEILYKDLKLDKYSVADRIGKFTGLLTEEVEKV